MFRAAFIIYLFLFLFAQTASAQIVATFYNNEPTAENFPHAFFRLQGTLPDGRVIDEDYGFTAVHLSPAIMWGSVKGEVQSQSPRYIARSTPQFSVALGEGGQAAVMGVVQKWRDRSGKSYHLNKRNCVHFVAEAIVALGLTINAESDYFKKPRDFMLEVKTLNPQLELMTPNSGPARAQTAIIAE